MGEAYPGTTTNFFPADIVLRILGSGLLVVSNEFIYTFKTYTSVSSIMRQLTNSLED
jgi:hypothetical protein